MRVHETDRLRNVALIGHGQSGKTSIAEAVLFAAGVTDRLGSVQDGNTVADSDEEETSRKISISLSLLPCEWNGHKINLLDTPGYADFGGDVSAALRVADAVILVVDAGAGVEVQTERYSTMAAERGLPRLLAVTKLDKEHTDFARSLAEVKDALKCNPVPLAVPIGSPPSLQGVVDLVRSVAHTASGGKESEGPIPEDMASVVAEHREKLLEAAAEADDELMEKYLEDENLSPQEVARGLRAATLAGKVVPTIPLCSLNMVGIRSLLDAIAADLPSPQDVGAVKGIRPGSDSEEERAPDPKAPLSALVFKTTADPYAGRLTYFRVYSGAIHSDAAAYNSSRQERERIGPLMCPVGKNHEGVPGLSAGDMGLVAKLHATFTGDTLCDEADPVALPSIDLPTSIFSVALSAKTRADEDKVGAAMARLVEEDPTIHFSMNPDTKESILAGLGDLHLEVVASRLRRKYGVEVETGAPKIPYKETIRGQARVQGRFRRQTGGRGQFGDVWIRVEPLPRGQGFEFANQVRGGSVPRNFVPAVEKGVREAMEKGVLAGYPITDLRAILDDGSSHPVDSSDLAFKIAGSMALQKAAEEAGALVLEPIVHAEVVVPSDQMGDIIGALNSKRAQILGMEPKGSLQAVSAQVPLAEMASYGSELRSMTGGRGTYTMQFSHYQEVPPHLTQSIIDAARQEKEQESAGR